MKLNLGCGFQTPDGWINVDYAFGARLSKLFLLRVLNDRFKFFGGRWSRMVYIHNLSKRLPWPDNSIDVIYTSHTLEHFTKNDGYRFLLECHRVLRKGGIIRVVVPDLSVIIKKYNCGELVAPDFLDALGVVNTSLGFLCINYFRNSFSSHKCMYDFPSLSATLNNIGFLAQSYAPLQSSILDIDKIEQISRTIDAVIAEGRKM